jgi:hypothetical protein
MASGTNRLSPEALERRLWRIRAALLDFTSHGSGNARALLKR